ncbi:MAG: S1 RNA-binding domain-containing protein, partial [Halobacteriales archaeon]
MGTCVICGSGVEGHVCASHEEDVCFEFTGNSPDQLTPNRFYRGTVDGFAEFGVFVDIGDQVTGLLHRSELPHRLESLDWDPGDSVYVQVTNVRDNGNVDLSWSIRQAPEEFRDQLVQTPEGDELPESSDEDDRPEAAGEGSADTTSSPEPTASASTPSAEAAPTADQSDGGVQASPASGGSAEAVSQPADAAADASAETTADEGGGAVMESPLKRTEI